MALSIAKSKTATKSSAKSKPAKSAKSETVKKVDRLVECKKKLAEVDHFAKEASEIEAEFKAEAAKSPDDQPVSFAGTEMVYAVDARKNTRTLIGGNKQVFDAMVKACGSLDAAMELASFKLSDIDKYLSDPEKAKLFKTERNGPRVGKLVPLS